LERQEFSRRPYTIVGKINKLHSLKGKVETISKRAGKVGKKQKIPRLSTSKRGQEIFFGNRIFFKNA
jgi:hypothetical protein